MRGSAIHGLGKGGALSLAPIGKATAAEVHRLYYKPRHKPGLRWGDALLQGAAVESRCANRGASSMGLSAYTRYIS